MKSTVYFSSKILNTLQKPDSECCIGLVISSIALRMGADLRHVSRVIHAGPPTTMEGKTIKHFC